MIAQYFPWRLFTKILVTLIVLMGGCFFVALAVATGGFQIDLSPDRWWALVFSFLLFAFFGAVIVAFRLTLPMRRVILKALRIASKKQLVDLGLPAESDEDDIYIPESGEYYELEVALDKIRKKLKKRRTQLAHEREEAQTLMTYLADAVFSLDREEKIKYFNSNFATQFLQPSQVRSHGEGVELKFTDVFRDPEVVQKVRTALSGGIAQTMQRKLPTLLDTTGRYFSLRTSPLREEKDREIYGAMVIFHDITDMKRAERMRAEFVENASHELRTPLTSIKGYLTTAREDVHRGVYDQLPNFLETINKSADRLIDLVNDLLTISVLENNPSLNWTEVRPEEVTEEVLERLTPLAMEKKIMIKSHYNCDPFKADFKLVDQVLTNLVGNAIKYIPAGGQVTVDWAQPRGAHEVTLSVRDNGPGIGEQHHARLFERFYRIDKGRSRDGGGTGLGLSIVKHIMQSHGGSVEIRSRLGEGSEFVCHFPIKG